METSTHQKPRSVARANKRSAETERIIKFCEHYSIGYQFINEYQIRINGKVDVFPTLKKYHFLDSYDYVEYETLEELFNKMQW